MVKWKKMNKKIAGLLLGVMMLFTASTTAFAYVDESAEASKVETTQTEQSTDKEEKKDEATNTNEVLPEDGTDKGTAFTTPGNGEVKDDITDDSTKEFLTVTTKNNMKSRMTLPMIPQRNFLRLQRRITTLSIS